MSTEKKKNVSLFKRPWIQSLIVMVVIFGSLGGFLYWQMTKDIISIEDSYLEAPIAKISPTAPGMLTDIYVAEGDRVKADAAIAMVGSETLYTKEEGIVGSAPKVTGTYFAPGQEVVSIIADRQMRVVGALKETDGLDRVKTGERATFTVDAFPGKQYEGVVDEVSPESVDTGIAFSISDKRPTKEFNIYVRFDVSTYPELKTGMSARIRIDTK